MPNWIGNLAWPGFFLQTCLLACLAGCLAPAPPPDVPVSLPQSFSRSGEQPLAERWWQDFGDQELNALIDRALAGNVNLRIFWARLDQAWAVARKVGADKLPVVSGEGRISAVRREGDNGKSVSHTTSLSLFASYEIDLWGRIRSSQAAALADVEASEYDLMAAAMLLSSQVAHGWLQWIELRGQLALLDEQAATNQKALQLVTQKFRAGQTSLADVLQQRQLVEAIGGESTQVAARIRVTEHQLAILLGDPPDQSPVMTQSQLVALPPLPATGLPVSLVQRRPDVLSAWKRLQATDQRLAAAVADQLPSLALTGRIETSADHIRDLFDDWLASIAANLVGPMIDGGRRKAEVARVEAQSAQALHEYGQTILGALGDVEDALVREEQQQLYLASLSRQLELAGQSVMRIRDRYRQGAENYQRVLTALISYQSLQRRHLAARRELIDHRIDLCLALGGGWDLLRPS